MLKEVKVQYKEAQGKRMRQQADQNVLNNVKVKVASLEWPQKIQ